MSRSLQVSRIASGRARREVSIASVRHCGIARPRALSQSVSGVSSPGRSRQREANTSEKCVNVLRGYGEGAGVTDSTNRPEAWAVVSSAVTAAVAAAMAESTVDAE